MTSRPRLLALAASCGWLLSTVPAQTVLWTGQGNLATFGDWNDPASWNSGAVPNGATLTAVINQSTTAYRNPPNGPYVNGTPVMSVPGGALPILTGPVILDALRFDLPPPDFSFQRAALYVGHPVSGITGSLGLDGTGLDIRTRNSVVPVDLNVSSGSTLTLAGRAAIQLSGVAQVNFYLSETNAPPTNRARLVFRDDASLFIAPSPLATVHALGPSNTVFQDRARAGNTVFQIGAQSTVEFHNAAQAESSLFNLLATDSLLLFDGNSSAGTSTIRFGGGFSQSAATVRFAGQSRALNSSITSPNIGIIGAVEFTEQASGDSINVSTKRLDISGAATAGGATGRQRAVTSGLAPASVVAGDARTVSLGTVTAFDVLLGSNTLELRGGFLVNIRDSGGAYLSAAGENLVGGGLLKSGPGTLQLGNPTFNPANPSQPSFNVFTGLTTVRGGMLSFNNRLASVNVEAAGTLTNGGSLGFVEGTLTNSGRVLPAFSTNPEVILRVIGHYVQTPTGTLDIYTVNEPGSYSRLSVTGTATLAGRLNLVTSTSFFPNRAPGTASLDIIQAGAVSGQFATVDSNLRIRPTVTYRTNGVTVQLELLPIKALAVTPGQRALGAYLDVLHENNFSFFPNNYRAIEDGLSGAITLEQGRTILTNFSPDRYGAIVEHGFATAAARTTTLDRQFAAARSQSGRAPVVFFEGGRRRFTRSAVDGVPASTAVARGGLAGVAWKGGRYLVGAWVAREKSTLALDAAGSAAEIEGTEPGVFAEYTGDRFFLNASAAFSRDHHQLRRVVEYIFFSPLTVTETAAPSGRRTDLALTAGYRFQSGGWSLTPQAGLLASRWSMDDFRETNSSTFQISPLVFRDWDSRSLRSRAGFDLTFATPKHRLEPHVSVSWLHEFDDGRTISAGFVGAASGYRAPGRPAERDLVLASAGLGVRIGRGATLQANCGGGWGRNSRLTSELSAGFRWSF